MNSSVISYSDPLMTSNAAIIFAVSRRRSQKYSSPAYPAVKKGFFSFISVHYTTSCTPMAKISSRKFRHLPLEPPKLKLGYYTTKCHFTAQDVARQAANRAAITSARTQRGRRGFRHSAAGVSSEMTLRGGIVTVFCAAPVPYVKVCVSPEMLTSTMYRLLPVKSRHIAPRTAGILNRVES